MQLTHDVSTERFVRQWGPGSEDTAATIFRDTAEDQPSYRVYVALAQIATRETRFTDLPGKKRLYIEVSGSTALCVDRVSLPAKGRFPSYRFDGGASTTCTRLSDQPALALNVVSEPDVEVKSTGPYSADEKDNWLLGSNSVFEQRQGLESLIDVLFCLEGPAQLIGPSSVGSISLQPFDAIVFQQSVVDQNPIQLQVANRSSRLVSLRILLSRV